MSGILGDVAEWLRSGLQSRLHRFDSGRRLSASRPDYSRDVGAARPGERRLGEHRLSKWSREDCIASVARYLEDAAGSRSTLRGYSRWAAKQESAPVAATLASTRGGKICASWRSKGFVRRTPLETRPPTRHPPRLAPRPDIGPAIQREPA